MLNIFVNSSIDVPVSWGFSMTNPDFIGYDATVPSDVWNMEVGERGVELKTGPLQVARPVACMILWK